MEKKIAYLGDIHGNLNVIESLNDRMEGFNIIQVGDFGIGFFKKQWEIIRHLDNQLGYKNNKLYIIRGNHDNPFVWQDSPIFENITFVKDFDFLEIVGVKHLFIGGATSIDRKHRMIGSTYWVEESVPFIDLVEFVGLTPDVIVTHTAPRSAPPYGFNHLVEHYASNDTELKKDLTLERNELDKVFNYFKDTPCEWFYGHFHMPLVENVEQIKFRCLNINEVYVLQK